MKTLDRYIGKSFLVGYLIAFCVLIGLRVFIDLFVNMDEFTERSDVLSILEIVKNIATFYGLNMSLYFRDFAGMITVVAAAFSLSKMIRANELIAIMASGISLKRVVAPILILSLLLTGILIIDQEIIIPSISHKLVRSHDYTPEKDTYDVWFISDENGSLICSQQYDVSKATFTNLTIITRELVDKAGVWRVVGRISAESATFNPQTRQWDLVNGRLIRAGSLTGFEPTNHYYAETLNPKRIPVMLKSDYKSLLSSKQLTELSAQNPKDFAQLYSQKHFRITDPIINFVMLMVSLPALVCRDPRAMKTAVMKSFTLTTVCTLMTFACKMLSTEQISLGSITPVPEFWAWLPVFVFLPIAFIELDSMKT